MNFQFLKNPITNKWVISAPRRAKRPDQATGKEPECPFCVNKEGEIEAYRVASEGREQTRELFGVESDWLVRVLNNKFPFAPIHEVVIHSPSHDRNFDMLPLEHVELILKTYRQRFLEHKDKGQVYIFHNRGQRGGESIPHPHTQLVVVPNSVDLEIPKLDPNARVGYAPHAPEIDGLDETDEVPENNRVDVQEMVETPCFYLFCPQSSQWPDEVWVAPKDRNRMFSDITDEEIKDFAHTLIRLIQIFTLRHGNKFCFNFYIYPNQDWYLRLIPRLKTVGGFELGTDVYVNTQDPEETLAFLKDHFENPDEEKIVSERQAEYRRGV